MHCFANQAQCLKLCDILYDSQIRNVAINFIADGSFGYNATSYRYCVDKLSSGGRSLVVLLYVHSGPGARRWESYKRLKIKSWAAGIRPEFINQKLLADQEFRDSYQNHLKANVRPLVRYAVASGAHVAIGWLEDNFTRLSFNMILMLTEQVLDEFQIEYVRNPVVLRAGAIPLRVVRETHSLSIASMPLNGWVFNDGEGFKFLSERPKDGEQSLADMRDIRHAAFDRGNIFILWIGQYQGDNGKRIINPRKRRYRLPKRSERAEIIQLLRGNY